MSIIDEAKIAYAMSCHGETGYVTFSDYLFNYAQRVKSLSKNEATKLRNEYLDSCTPTWF